MLTRKFKVTLKKIASLFSVIRGYNIWVIVLAQYLSAIFILAPEKRALAIILDWQLFLIAISNATHFPSAPSQVLEWRHLVRQGGDGVPHSTKRLGTGRSGRIYHPELPEQIVGVILHIDGAHAGARLLGQLGRRAVPGAGLMSFVIGRIGPRAPHDQRDRTSCALEQLGRLIATPLDKVVVDGQQHIAVPHACLVRRGARYDVTERGSLQVSSRRRRRSLLISGHQW
jgi:hypothetical protein